MRVEAALFVREYSLGLAVVVAMVGCDDFQQHVACVGNKRNPSVVVAISSVLLFVNVKDLGDRMLPLLGDFLCYSNVDKDDVENSGRIRGVEVSYFGVQPGGHLAQQLFNLTCFRHIVHGWVVSERWFRRSRRQDVDGREIEFQRLRAHQVFVAGPRPSFTNSDRIQQQTACHPRPR